MDSRGALLVAALVLAAPNALAAPTAAQRETARRLMDEGKERMRAGEKERAVLAYQKAHDLMHVPTTGIALARAHLALGHLVEARDVALEVVRMPRESGEPAVFEHARKSARELEASIKPRIPTVRIVVRGGPATKVTVDDQEVAGLLVGEPMALNPGRHVIVARNADGIDKRADIELAERDAKEVELPLPSATPHVAVVMPSASPKPAERLVRQEREERSVLANVLVFGGFSVGVAGLAVGGITGAMALSKSSDVKPLCESGICDPAAEADLSSARGLATVSTIGFAAAGAGVALGVVGLLLPKTKSESALHSEEPRTAVWITPGGAGIRGSF